MDTKWASVSKVGSSGSMRERLSSFLVKTMLPMQRSFVLPRCGTVVYSHDRMATKNPPQASSAVQAAKEVSS